MLKLSVNLDPGKPIVRTARNVEVGTTFQIAIVAWDDGKDESPSIFDTIVVEILFNNLAPVLRVNPDELPAAGDLARSGTAVDAFSHQPISAGSPADAGQPFSRGTLLTLKRPSGDPLGPYQGSTGRAGMSDFDSLFKISAGERLTVAAGKAEGGPQADVLGTSNMIVVGVALLDSRPLPMESLVSTVSVIPRRR